MGLKEYKAKRDFSRTPEPEGERQPSPSGRSFVVQKHVARRLHYDFRLELDGVLKSWAVPKGPSLDPGEKRLAVQVEDHPVEYGSFEGAIPEGEYGGGTVLLWDRGEWQPQGDPHEGLKKGRLKFRLEGEKLRGGWSLVRMKGQESGGKQNWLLIKDADEFADRESDITAERAESVASGQTMEQIQAGPQARWEGGKAVPAGKDPVSALTAASSEDGRAKESADGRKPARRKRSTRKPALDPASLASALPSALVSALTGARPGDPPQDLRPQMAALVDQVPPGGDWLHEIKFDGYRLLCYLETGEPARLVTRTGKDWTERFPGIARAAGTFPAGQAILDGEAVVLLPDGTTDFQALQNVRSGVQEGSLVFYLFDLPYCEGHDLRQVPLLERKQFLRALLESGSKVDPALRYSDHIQGKGETVFQHACRFALEGTISKLAGSHYQPGRTRTWIKVKCIQRQEFVVVGYSEPQGTRRYFGALLLGYYDDGEGGLVYAGRVGTGFDRASLAEIAAQLDGLEQEDSPVKDPPRGSLAHGVHWVRPELVAEIEFANWTGAGRLRQPSFKGLRQDKPAGEVRRERPEPAPGKETDKMEKTRGKERQEPVQVAGVTLSNPERALFPEMGVTKRQLAEYYAQAADWVLPHVVERPLTLVRCPSGQGEKCFFQKHYDESFPEAVGHVPVVEKEGEESEYFLIRDLQGLVGLVQMGVLELHPWGSRADRLERPDQMIFDLDPDPVIGWPEVRTAALQVRDRLERIGLESYVKTSGGKGLHVVVPLARRSDWEEVYVFAKDFAGGIASDDPDLYTATASKAKRRGKIFVDYLRNSRGATNVAAYSTRARSGAPVSTPLRWEELPGLESAQAYHLGNLPARLDALKTDPWEGFFNTRQSITKAMRERVAG